MSDSVNRDHYGEVQLYYIFNNEALVSIVNQLKQELGCIIQQPLYAYPNKRHVYKEREVNCAILVSINVYINPIATNCYRTRTKLKNIFLIF